ncbi:anti-sigma factor [Nodosilinea sp. LEGE 06152]|uniref:anti-sigma factor n=1 Tax=Nodosilinea sp. LEGE 06152 TaxID=2777966 RepID=UPI00187E0E15|nr:anti-sigma factor [Nodosilinea sp. LEGE 06152]MBE9158996.1 anti-sigma factor [Nodosilinea sp. LEGE 06152]
MNSTPLPENWRSLLAGYVLNDLTDHEATLVEQWLDQYPEVASELEALQSTWESLPTLLPPVAPSPGVRDRVMAAVQNTAVQNAAAQTPDLALEPIPAPAIVRRRLPLGKLVLALGWAATGLALVLALQENQRLRLALTQQEAVVASFSQPGNPLYTLSGTDAEPQASGRLVVNPDAQTALIVTTDLPPLSPDQVYRLWALADSDPVFCGQFNPKAGQNTNQWILPNAACSDGSVQMLVTAERAADPPIPAGDLVLQSRS